MGRWRRRAAARETDDAACPCLSALAGAVVGTWGQGVGRPVHLGYAHHQHPYVLDLTDSAPNARLACRIRQRGMPTSRPRSYASRIGNRPVCCHKSGQECLIPAPSLSCLPSRNHAAPLCSCLPANPDSRGMCAGKSRTSGCDPGPEDGRRKAPGPTGPNVRRTGLLWVSE